MARGPRIVAPALTVVALLVAAGCAGGRGSSGSPSPSATASAGSAGFSETAVAVESPAASLPGVLSVPATPGRHPGVILLGGSGPTDRDGTVGSTKPLRDLAHGLAPRGIVVLRYDKRPRAQPAQFIAKPDPTLRDEYIDDAVAAVALLRQRPEVDPDRIFVLGHSLGALVAPRLLIEDPLIAGLVMMATPRESIEDGIVRQTRYLANLDGVVTPDEQRGLDQAERDSEAIRQLVAGVPVTPLPFGLPRSYWVDLHNYDPVAALLRTKQPILLMQGGRDYQVRPEDLAGWEQDLTGRPRVTTKRYPRCNHLFLEGDGPSSPAEYQSGGHVSPAVIADVGDWISAN